MNVNLGWIDFSRSDRDKVLNVLDKLSEPTTLDELGIAPVRDGFANLFFPGTSSRCAVRVLLFEESLLVVVELLPVGIIGNAIHPDNNTELNNV